MKGSGYRQVPCKFPRDPELDGLLKKIYSFNDAPSDTVRRLTLRAGVGKRATGIGDATSTWRSRWARLRTQQGKRVGARGRQGPAGGPFLRGHPGVRGFSLRCHSGILAEGRWGDQACLGGDEVARGT